MRLRKPSLPAVVTAAMTVLAIAPLGFFASTSGHHHPDATAPRTLPACAGGNGSAAAAAAYMDGGPLPCRSYTYDPAGIVAILAGATVLPACEAEDGGPVLPCRWEVRDHGGGGTSFAVVAMNGNRELWYVYDNGNVSRRPR
jgi:hypothetical protein